MPYVNTQTGQQSSMSPEHHGDYSGTASQWQWHEPPKQAVPSSIFGVSSSDPYTPLSANRHVNRTQQDLRDWAPRPISQFEKNLLKALAYMLLAVAVAAGVGAIGLLAYQKYDLYWTAKNASGSMVFSPTEVRLRSFFPKLRGQPTFLVGAHVIVRGDIDKLDVFAYRDLTVEGNISGSHVASTIGTLTVHNAENSVLEAHRIIITGTAVNTKQVLLPQPRANPHASTKRIR